MSEGLKNWESREKLRSIFLINRLLSPKNPLFKKIGLFIFKKLIENSSIPIIPHSTEGLNIISVGNSHLDSAWKWRKDDTRRKKIQHTFGRNVFYLESNKFPNYFFTANSIVHYEWIKQDYPEMFEKIRGFIKEGRWEIVGGDWVEMDCNLPNGESLVRQRLIGQHFYLREFGKLAKIAWMDDVFGWPNTLPQIFAKSGAEYFFTNKFSYSTYSVQFEESSPDYAGKERFPFLHFFWQSPDGSKVIVTWAKHKVGFVTQLEQFTKHSRLVKETIENKFHYGLNWSQINEKCTNEIIPLIFNAYGQGDGGMGPKPYEISFMTLLEQEGYTKIAPARYFFDLLKEYDERLPIWEDELYLEGHRGTLTSVEMIKENNHTAEVLLQQTDILAALCYLFTGNRFDDIVQQAWKNILFLQFHDVLPGSSIPEVYRDAAKEYNTEFQNLREIQEKCAGNTLKFYRNDASQTEKSNVICFNTLSWNRSDYLYIPSSLIDMENLNDKNEGFQIAGWSPFVVNREFQYGFTDVPGTDYLRNPDGLEELQREINKTKNFEGAFILVDTQFLPSIPSLGFISLHLEQLGLDKPHEKPKIKGFSEKNDVIEFNNDTFWVKINKKTGKIGYVAEKQDGFNVIGKDGVGYAFYQDKKVKYDSWDLPREYMDHPLPFGEVKSVKIIENGPLRYSLLIEHDHTPGGTILYTRLSFMHEGSMIYGETLVNWQEDRKVLRLKIDTNLTNQTVLCGSPYGNNKRPSIAHTVYQKAMYECAFQQYIYWENEEKSSDTVQFQAIGCYSQTKYGMNANGGTIGITFLKAPEPPKPKKKYATMDDDYGNRVNINDTGFHRIPWGLEFFNKTESKIKAVKRGYEYNYPMLMQNTTMGNLEFSFMSLNCDHVFITTVKPAEPYFQTPQDDLYKPNLHEIPLIVRIVEYSGLEEEVELNVHPRFSIKNAEEVDLLERRMLDTNTIRVRENSLYISMKKYEIKTILTVFHKKHTR